MRPPSSRDEWKQILRERFARQNREFGIQDDRAREAFQVTAWGEVPTRDQILSDFPMMEAAMSPFPNLMRFSGA